MDGPMRTGQRGAVLVVVVLLTVALLGVAHALLVASEAAYTVSRAHARAVELDAVATGGVEAELRRGWRAWMDSVAVGSVRLATDSISEGVGRTVTWRRLGDEAWTVAARAQPPSAAPLRSRRLVWIYDPAARIAALPAVVSTGPGAPVDIRGRVVSSGAPPLGTVDAPALGLLDLEAILNAADSTGPDGTPTPVEAGGVCDVSDAWNWGDPLRPYRPCGPYFVLEGRRGALTLTGGSGQGVVVVDGDLSLRSGAFFSGLVVASGVLSVTEGSMVEGRVVAFGGLDVGVTGEVVESSSRAREALAAVRTRLASPRLLHPALRLGPG